VYSSTTARFTRVDYFRLEFRGPEFRLLLFDGIIMLMPKFQGCDSSRHDVLNLLGRAREFILGLEPNITANVSRRNAFKDEWTRRDFREELVVLERARLEVRSEDTLFRFSTMLSLL